MTQILFSSPSLEPARADQTVRSFEQRLGPPDDVSLRSGSRGPTTERRWRGASTELRVTVEPSHEPGLIMVWEEYTPLPSPVETTESCPPADSVGAAVLNPPPPHAPPALRRRRDLEGADGARVRLQGTYEITDMGPYRMAEEEPDGTVRSGSRVVVLRLADGGGVVLGLRPADEMSHLDGRLVEVTGILIVGTDPQPSHVSRPDPLPALTGPIEVRAVER